jgi:hypothetical protein
MPTEQRARQPAAKNADVNLQLRELVQLVYEAVFSFSDADEVRAALKAAACGDRDDGSPDLAIQARKVIGNLLLHGTLGGELRTLRESVDGLKDVQRQLLDNNVDYLLNTLLPHGEFRRRYEKDFPQRSSLVSYVAETFFQEQVHCFIHGSVTAIHLGKELVKRGAICDGSLFYTNSAVFPLAVLCPKGLYAVYAFCGSIYDPVCGAWLFPVTDSKTTGELRELFTRKTDPLTKAFLMPLAVTPSGIYYERPETAFFCKTMLALASEVTIMTMGDCLLSEDKVAQYHCDPLDGWPKKSISLVIAGRSPHLQQIVDCFAGRGVAVHSQRPDSLQWQTTTLPPPS